MDMKITTTESGTVVSVQVPASTTQPGTATSGAGDGGGGGTGPGSGTQGNPTVSLQRSARFVPDFGWWPAPDTQPGVVPHAGIPAQPGDAPDTRYRPWWDRINWLDEVGVTVVAAIVVYAGGALRGLAGSGAGFGVPGQVPSSAAGEEGFR